MSALVFRVDATTKIGIGHVMRCLALAQAWQDSGGKVIFISCCESDLLRQRLIVEGIDFVPHEQSHPATGDIEHTLRILTEAPKEISESGTWVVVDGYHFDADYQKRIKDAGFKLLWIDDYGHADHYWADIVLNPNISADKTLYRKREPYTRLLLGTRYVILRREFWPWRNWKRDNPEIVKRVLVTMGGGDPDNVTLKVIRAFNSLNDLKLEVKIVVGPANPNRESLKKELSMAPFISRLLTEVNDMPDLMAWADIAISAAGSTCWELAYMMLPSLLLILADNQAAVANRLDDCGFAVNIGDCRDLTEEEIAGKVRKILADSKQRSLMSQRGRKLVDGDGGSRVRRILEGDALRLRSVHEEDCERIWMWANEPKVRAASFSKAAIPWEDHIRWFSERKNRPFFYVALNGRGIPIGQVRFDLINAELVISVMVDKEFRNRGYGEALVKMACEKIFKCSEFYEIHAYVEKDNKISHRTFRQAGFREHPERYSQVYEAHHFILSKQEK
jgi:UDP-2,4-diacetamido-2,4,6-trideoxy-beta-L-altropyranose hydrolase